MMLLTLEEAALQIRPDGLVSPRSLRAEISAGRLAGHRIAGRIFIAEGDLDVFIQTARQTSPPAASRERAPGDTIGAKRTRSAKPAISSSVHLLTAVATGLTRRRG